MAQMIINDVRTGSDLIALSRYLLDLVITDDLDLTLSADTVRLAALVAAPTSEAVAGIVRLDDDYGCDGPQHRDGGTCRLDAALTDARQGVLVDLPAVDGPPPYVRCPAAGSHQRLSECWMCWSDVKRGFLDERDVLALTTAE